MADEILSRDQNRVTVLGGITDDANQYITMLRVDPTTKRLLVSATGLGSGTVTSVSVASANGFAGTVATATTTPAITLSTTITGILKGNGTAISAITVGSGLSYDGTTLSATGGSGTVTEVSSANGALSVATGTTTPVLTVNSAPILTTARTIGGVSFDGSANITVATATGGFTVSGGNLALGTNSLTLTGSIAATGSRVTKGWFTDLESTNMPTVGGTAILSSLTAPTFNTIELGTGQTDTTLSRVSAGLVAIEGVNIMTVGATQTVTGQNKFNNIIDVNNAITASGNAATVPVTYRLSTVTNNSAATLTITMTTTSAVDGQMTIVRILDFSAVAQTITWVNTENSTVSAPVTSNGSTTLPLTVGFMYNSATSKWRCIASA